MICNYIPFLCGMNFTYYYISEKREIKKDKLGKNHLQRLDLKIQLGLDGSGGKRHSR